MKGKGQKQERETVIIYNEVDSLASIWTASEPEYRRLKKLGYEPVEDRERSASFEVPKKYVSVRKPVATSEKQLKALEMARAIAKARSVRESLKLQGQNGEKGVSREESWRQ